MALELPDDMEKLVYFTRRRIDGELVVAWVDKVPCPKCKKSLMSKPKDKKTGRPKIRAQEYICVACGYSEEKKVHEAELKVSVKYSCPHCKKAGEYTGPFKWKSITAVKTIRVVCDHCGGNVDVTKKMKLPKPKK